MMMKSLHKQSIVIALADDVYTSLPSTLMWKEDPGNFGDEFVYGEIFDG
jgi:hypothetical protein